MQRIDTRLITPVYVKSDDHSPLPDDPVYYLLASNHLYLCRNHAFYQSSVPAPQWPTELAAHDSSLTPKFPAVPKADFESICGFFAHLSYYDQAEGIVLLAWDQSAGRVRTIVPRQVSTVGATSTGINYPIGVKYQFPKNLPAQWRVFGDIHSHCDLPAYASETDVDDEHGMSGLHIVVGRLCQEPPEFHAEAVIDGTRFKIEFSDAVAVYRRRSPFPAKWRDRVVVTNLDAARPVEVESDESSAT